MIPHAEPSPYHDHRPLLHDFQYHVEDGRPVLDEESSDAE